MALYEDEIRITLVWEWQEERQQLSAEPAAILTVRFFNNKKNEWEEIGEHHLLPRFNVEQAREIVQTIIDDHKRELAKAPARIESTDPDFDSVF